MDSNILRGAELSYYAIYDQNLREEMEECGMLSEDRDGYGDDSKFKQDTDAKSFRPGKDVPKPKKFGRISRAMPASISGHATRTISANTTAAGEDPGAPRSQKIARTTKLVKTKTGWKKVQAEELDAYDIILMHLLDEGYAPNPDAAEAIMVNMSEQWIESILG
jgi:hypothetical protein